VEAKEGGESARKKIVSLAIAGKCFGVMTREGEQVEGRGGEDKEEEGEFESTAARDLFMGSGDFPASTRPSLILVIT
jgi:hypothetical protein